MLMQTAISFRIGRERVVDRFFGCLTILQVSLVDVAYAILFQYCSDIIVLVNREDVPVLGDVASSSLQNNSSAAATRQTLMSDPVNHRVVTLTGDLESNP